MEAAGSNESKQGAAGTAVGVGTGAHAGVAEAAGMPGVVRAASWGSSSCRFAGVSNSCAQSYSMCDKRDMEMGSSMTAQQSCTNNASCILN